MEHLRSIIAAFLVFPLALAFGCSPSGDESAPTGDAGLDIGALDVPGEVAGDVPGEVAGDVSGEPSEDTDQQDGATDTGSIDIHLVEGCNPFATTQECLFPFPSSFFEAQDPTTATGVRLAYHQEVVEWPEGSPEVDLVPFNRADGVPPSVPILLTAFCSLT